MAKPDILKYKKHLPAAFAVDGEPLLPSRIYVAPADFHLRVAKGRVELSKGPRENWSRPAIDPTFRTAAEEYGPDCIGVVLTGNLNDGTAGLYEIKRRGGIAVVQDPDEAEVASMPRSALDNVEVDYCVKLGEMPEVLLRLTAEPEKKRVAVPGVAAMKERSDVLEQPVALTCPECGGAMRQRKTGHLRSFHCHIGHAMSAEILAEMQVESIENLISATQRALRERAELCSEMARSHTESGDRAAAELWRVAEQQSRDQAERMRIVAEEGRVRPELSGASAK
jgi:two-component system chemotaxis response regulator CheB